MQVCRYVRHNKNTDTGDQQAGVFLNGEHNHSQHQCVAQYSSCTHLSPKLEQKEEEERTGTNDPVVVKVVLNFQLQTTDQTAIIPVHQKD